MRQFVALFACVLSRLLRLARRHARLHIGVDIVAMSKQVLNYVILHSPGKKVQLTNGGRNTVEVYARPTAEWIKHLLTVGLEMRLVCQIHNHVLSGFRNVGHVVLLGIIGDEPIQNAQGNIGLVSENIAK